MFELRYIPGSPYGAKFPLWRFGQRTTRESADATRMQCATPDQIEVVEVADTPRKQGETGMIGAQLNGPERGVGTSGRGLADASKGVD